jgi:hypothetical protein
LPFSATVAVFGERVTAISTTFTFTVAVFELSAFNAACTMTFADGGVEGAVYSPLAEIEPQAAPVQELLEILQVTAVSLVPVTLAVNCWVKVTPTDTALLGEIAIWTPPPPPELEPPPPQPIRRHRANTEVNKASDFIGVSVLKVRLTRATALHGCVSSTSTIGRNWERSSVAPKAIRRRGSQG